MKVYREYSKPLVTVVFFLSFGCVTAIILPDGPLLAIPLVILLAGVFLFEFQKSTLAKTLKQKTIGPDDATAFIFDNGVKHDFFENILLLSSAKIIVTTCYLPVQRYFNAWIGKQSYLKVFETAGSTISVDMNKHILILRTENREERLQIPHFSKLISELERFSINYNRV